MFIFLSINQLYPILVIWDRDLGHLIEKYVLFHL